MRPSAFPLLAITVLGACSGPRVDVAAETAHVRARSQALAAVEASQNTEGALAYWAQDAIAQPAGAPQIQGREAIRALYNSFFGGGQLKKFEGTTTQLQVSSGGDLAYEYGVNRMVLPGPKGDLLDVGKYLVVWKKIDGEWYVAALSFTSDAPAPVPVQSN
jgi:ketosteroid isomerase-like protein